MAVYMTDDFTDSNGERLNASRWDDSWSGQPTTPQIYFNRASGRESSGGARVQEAFAPATANYQVSCTFRFSNTTLSDYCRILLRTPSNSLDGYCFYVAGNGDWRFERFDSASNTILASGNYASLALNVNYPVVFSITGDQCTITFDGQNLPVPPDATYSAAGMPALLLLTANARIDNWVFEDVVSQELTFNGIVDDYNYQVDVPITDLDLSTYFSGGTPPYTYAVTTGVLPTGLQLDSNTGIISGTPTVVDEISSIIVTATDQDTETALTNQFTLTIIATANQPPVQDTPIADFNGTEGELVVSRDISTQFSDPDGDSITFTQSGIWPAGVTLSSAGVIAGTYAAGSAGTYNAATVDFTDGVNAAVTSTPFTFNVAVAGASSVGAFTEPLDAGGGTPATGLAFDFTFFPGVNNIGNVADGSYQNGSGTTSGSGGVSVTLNYVPGTTGLLIIKSATGLYAAEEITTS